MPIYWRGQNSDKAEYAEWGEQDSMPEEQPLVFIEGGGGLDFSATRYLGDKRTEEEAFQDKMMRGLDWDEDSLPDPFNT